MMIMMMAVVRSYVDLSEATPVYLCVELIILAGWLH
jgi:hypothetical protein